MSDARTVNPGQPVTYHSTAPSKVAMAWAGNVDIAARLDALEREVAALRVSQRREVAIAVDGRCDGDCGAPCPLGRRGAQNRCTREELEAAGVVVAAAGADRPLRPGDIWHDPEGTVYEVIRAEEVCGRPRWLVGHETTPEHLKYGLRSRADLHTKPAAFHPYVLVERFPADTGPTLEECKRKFSEIPAERFGTAPDPTGNPWVGKPRPESEFCPAGSWDYTHREVNGVFRHCMANGRSRDGADWPDGAVLGPVLRESLYFTVPPGTVEIPPRHMGTHGAKAAMDAWAPNTNPLAAERPFVDVLGGTPNATALERAIGEALGWHETGWTPETLIDRIRDLVAFEAYETRAETSVSAPTPPASGPVTCHTDGHRHTVDAEAFTAASETLRTESAALDSIDRWYLTDPLHPTEVVRTALKNLQSVVAATDPPSLTPSRLSGPSLATIPPGLYTLHWRVGDSALAAVGMFQDGRRWFAPCKWAVGVPSVDWGLVESAEPIPMPKS